MHEEPLFLKEAYPMPRYSIKDAVMAQIAEERTASGEQKTGKTEEKKILTFGEKVRKHRSAIAKWGGIAACAVFLLGVLTVTGPMMKKTNDSAEQIRGENGYGLMVADAAEKECEDLAMFSYTDEDADNGKYYSVTGGTDENEPEAPEGADTEAPKKNDIMKSQLYVGATSTEAAAGSAGERTTEATADCRTDAVTEAVTTEETMAEPEYTSAEGTDTADCIKAMVTEQIPQSEYTEWLASNRYCDPADYSLAELVTDFSITHADLTEMLGEYADYVDMDVLYSTTAEDALTDDMSPEELDALVIEEE
ncbi:MAG: hypothetical protein IJ325_03650 [Clostridia bacterium]|nr:hypothetical protein [Clostridia bacterium]